MEPEQRYYLNSLVETYLTALAKRGRGKKETTESYRRELHRMIEALDAAGMKFTPAKIGEDEVDHIRNELYGHLKPKTVQWYVSILSGWLKFNKNNVVERMMISWPSDNRVRIDWMSIDEAVALIDAAKGVERPIVHLELRLMMRRCEVVRLTVQDVYQGVLEARGKGHGKGKWRSLAFAPETLSVLQEWEEQRERIIAEAQSRDPSVTVPDNYLIWREGTKLYPYSEDGTGIDKILHRVAERAGIDRPIGNHTNRRSGARFVIQADPDNMPVLVEALGHASESQTRRYCGLTVDDMTRMHIGVSNLLENARARMSLTHEAPKPPAMRISR